MYICVDFIEKKIPINQSINRSASRSEVVLHLYKCIHTLNVVTLGQEVRIGHSNHKCMFCNIGHRS